MKRLFTSLLLAMLLTASTANATVITATGQGNNESDAEADALRRAVEYAAGMLLKSETVIEKNTILKDKIYTATKGYIRSYEVTKIKKLYNRHFVTVTADVANEPDSKLMNDLTRLGIIEHKMRNPKIAVYLPERHSRYIPDPAAETALINELLNAGFTNVTATDHANIRNTNADFLIIGEAFSESTGDIGRNLPGYQRTNLLSVKARAEAKLYNAKTKQIIATEGTYANAVDVSESIASKKSLAAAGKKLGQYLSEKLLENGSGNRHSFEIQIESQTYEPVNELLAELNILNIKNVNLSRYENGNGTITCSYEGSARELYEELYRIKNKELIEADYNTLKIKIH